MRAIYVISDTVLLDREKYRYPIASRWKSRHWILTEPYFYRIHRLDYRSKVPN